MRRLRQLGSQQISDKSAQIPRLARTFTTEIYDLDQHPRLPLITLRLALASMQIRASSSRCFLVFRISSLSAMNAIASNAFDSSTNLGFGFAVMLRATVVLSPMVLSTIRQTSSMRQRSIAIVINAFLLMCIDLAFSVNFADVLAANFNPIGSFAVDCFLGSNADLILLVEEFLLLTTGIFIYFMLTLVVHL